MPDWLGQLLEAMAAMAAFIIVALAIGVLAEWIMLKLGDVGDD